MSENFLAAYAKMMYCFLRNAIDHIPLMGQTTRIDRAFRLVQSEMFAKENGGRENVPKLLILMTDGSQTEDLGAEDPADIADELRADGITVIVVGVGADVDPQELNFIAGGDDKTFTVSSFDQLINSDFTEKLTSATCDVGMYIHLA